MHNQPVLGGNDNRVQLGVNRPCATPLDSGPRIGVLGRPRGNDGVLHG